MSKSIYEIVFQSGKNKKTSMSVTDGIESNYNITSSTPSSITNGRPPQGEIGRNPTSSGSGSSSNFMAIVPDSHFWTSTEMMMEWVRSEKANPREKDPLEYIRVGLENMRKNGYSIQPIASQNT